MAGRSSICSAYESSPQLDSATTQSAHEPLLDCQMYHWPPNVIGNKFGTGPQILLLKWEILAPFYISLYTSSSCSVSSRSSGFRKNSCVVRCAEKFSSGAGNEEMLLRFCRFAGDA